MSAGPAVPSLEQVPAGAGPLEVPGVFYPAGRPAAKQAS